MDNINDMNNKIEKLQSKKFTIKDIVDNNKVSIDGLMSCEKQLIIKILNDNDEKLLIDMIKDSKYQIKNNMVTVSIRNIPLKIEDEYPKYVSLRLMHDNHIEINEISERVITRYRKDNYEVINIQDIKF